MQLVTAFLAAIQPIAPVPVLPDTAASYVEPGQDRAGYDAWIAGSTTNQARVAAYQSYLSNAGVGDVVPVWQLVRTASDWKKCDQPAFEVPPAALWPGMVNTLRYVRDSVEPAIGDVEILSSYRNPYLNSCAGGSARSVHRNNSAIDMVPVYPFERGELMSRLCTVHARDGRRYDVGFGFYVGLRFHVDTWKYRIWGVDPALGGRQCGIALERREAARSEQDE